MKRFQFHLSISAESYPDYYRGAVRHVVVRCPEGVTIQFPAALLQPFVTSAGIQGDFALTCDDGNRGADLQRLPVRS